MILLAHSSGSAPNTLAITSITGTATTGGTVSIAFSYSGSAAPSGGLTGTWTGAIASTITVTGLTGGAMGTGTATATVPGVAGTYALTISSAVNVVATSAPSSPVVVSAGVAPTLTFSSVASSSVQAGGIVTATWAWTTAQPAQFNVQWSGAGPLYTAMTYSVNVPAKTLTATFSAPLTAGTYTFTGMGALNSTAVSNASSSITVTAVGAGDGLTGPLVYAPSDFYTNSNQYPSLSLGSFLPRGTTGAPIITLGGSAAAYVSLQGLQVVENNGANSLNFAPIGTYPLTISVTDGVTTLPLQTINCHVVANTTPVPLFGSNVVFSNAPYVWASTYGSTCRRVGIISSIGVPNSSITVTDPSGWVTWDADDGQLITTAADISPGYGAHVITVTVAGVPYTTTIWIAKEAQPVITFTPNGTIYDTTLPYSAIGTVKTYSETNTYYNSMPTNPGGLLYLMSNNPNGPLGLLTPAEAIYENPNTLYTTGALTAGTLNFIVQMTSGTTTAALPVALTVAAGTALAPSNLTPSFSSSLDWSMASGTVGTITVSGMSGALSWSIDVVDDTVQHRTSYVNGTPQLHNPRYIITGSGTTATVTFVGLSAQTDVLLISVTNGTGTRCTATIPLVIAQTASVTKTIGPAGGGFDFTSITDAYTDIHTNPGSYPNGVIWVMSPVPNNYSDITGLGASSGQIWNKPIICDIPDAQYAAGTFTVIDAQGATGKGIFTCRYFDMVLRRGFEIRNSSNGGGQYPAGDPNAAGLWSDGQTPGNTTVHRCLIHHNDNGFLAGDAGRNIVITDSVICFNGLGQSGTTHNIYVPFANSLVVSTCYIFTGKDGHQLKSRARKTTVTNCVLADGSNGIGSRVIDITDGGIVTITNNVIMKGPNASNSEILGYADEQYGMWPVNSLTVTGNKFLNLVPHSAFAGDDTVAISFWQGVDPDRGRFVTSSISGNTFYRVPAANRIYAQNAILPVNIAGQRSNPAYLAPTDAGGNITQTTYVPIAIPHPLTGAPMTVPINGGLTEMGGLNPYPANGNTAQVLFTRNSLPRIMLGPYIMVATGAAGIGSGVALTGGQMIAYGNNGSPLTGVTWNVTNATNDLNVATPGYWTVPGGMITTATTGIAEGPYFLYVSASGTDVWGNTIPLTTIIAIIIGSGVSTLA